jgi:hypothetical protein
MNIVATANAANLGANVLYSVNVNAVTGFITTANVSNVVIAYSAGGITIDTRAAVGGGGGGGAISNNGTLVLGMPNANVNFLSTGTVNAIGVANGTTQVNVSFAVNASAISAAAGGSTTQVQYNNGGALAGSANVTLNTTSSTLQVEGNVLIGNTNSVLFGGAQSNVANAHFGIAYNVTAGSLDFTFIG